MLTMPCAWQGAHNIGFAVDTPTGLVRVVSNPGALWYPHDDMQVVPNVKNVQNRTIFEVASEVCWLVYQTKLK